MQPGVTDAETVRNNLTAERSIMLETKLTGRIAIYAPGVIMDPYSSEDRIGLRVLAQGCIQWTFLLDSL